MATGGAGRSWSRKSLERRVPIRVRSTGSADPMDCKPSEIKERPEESERAAVGCYHGSAHSAREISKAAEEGFPLGE
ncbi:MAG: hypothetical protein DWQ01_01490 [Planctomycetota bacterium]|nr:MAG: hypothetical protein DWQ01_01490 [Planctomycetota bacterium]